MSDDKLRIVREEIIADDHYPLKKLTFEQRRRDGTWQTRTREVYDCASGAAVLPYDRAHRRVVLTRQFRPGARLNGHDGFLLEAVAGILEGADPRERVRSEALEEAGYALDRIDHAMDLFISPGSTTERMHLFTAPVEAGKRQGPGGGKADEGEDIEVVELDFDDALAMIGTGAIVDAKTVLLLLHLERQVLGRHGEAS